MKVITRFPPSPTGDLHVGGARTALFNWLYAKKHGGTLVLRIEDTDRERSTQAAVDVILEALEWLGLDWGNELVFQSKRSARYAEAVHQLIDTGHAYYCCCSKEKLESIREAQRVAGQKPRYDRCCRELGHKPTAGDPAVVRFKNPLDGVVVFEDRVRGAIRIANDELDDLVIARTDGSPTYNLTVVVDDIDMGITHVIRGDDHINNTPRQINLFHALGSSLPVFAHLPMIADSDGKRLSKRLGSVSVLEYRDMGILPEALLNYLALLGWSHGHQEIFSITDMIELFEIEAVNKSAANFDQKKLLWLNQQVMQSTNAKRLAKELGDRLQQRGICIDRGPALVEVADMMRERAQTLDEMAGKVIYLYDDVDEYEYKAANKHLHSAAVRPLQAVRAEFEKIDDWREPAINQAITHVLETESIKLAALAQPLRVAVSGGAATPPIDVTLRLVGFERVLARIDKALDWIDQNVKST